MDITWIVAAAVLLLLVVAALVLMRRRDSERLQNRFGPEYERAVNDLGSRGKAESELLAREKRVEKLHIVPLPPELAGRFVEEWRMLQGRFVDQPQGALMDADRLVTELMRARGYPMADFDTRAADISVHHPAVVHHYRAARDIALRDQRGEADTEALRQAVVHYRALFSELLEVDDPHGPPPERRAVPPRDLHEPVPPPNRMETY